MNILIVSQYFWPENFRINDLAVNLVERGYNVTVLTGTPNYPDGNYFPGYGIFKKTRSCYKGVKVIRTPLIPRGKGSGLQLALNYLSYVFFASLLGPVFCRDKYDLIFVCQLSPVTVGLPALFLKWLKRAPIIFWILDLWPDSVTATGAIRSESIRVRLDQLVKFIYNRCDKIIVGSKGFVGSVKAKGIDIAQTDYLPNWYEPEYKFNGAIVKDEEHPELPEGFRIMFAGAIGVAQDFESILWAAEKLKSYSDIHWIILGDGRRYDWVQEQIQSRGLNDNFHLLGRHEPSMMPGYFACADIMLVTLKNESAFALTVPGKIQSYMACGKPIVAAINGEGARLINDSGAGFATAAEDPTALAESILSMYRMPKEQRDLMGNNGQQYCIENFDRDMLMDRLEGWIHEIAQN